jgi:hypothetical protein
VEHEPRQTPSVQQISIQDSNPTKCQRLKVRKELHIAFGTLMETKKTVAG